MAALLCLVAASPVRAFSLRATTLWDLTARSERIVLARVDAVREDRPGDRVAVLAVEETWKGPPEARLEALFPLGASLLCLPHYEPGARVLVFLVPPSSRPEGAFWALQGGQGILYPEEEDVPVYRERVRAALELLAAGQGREGADRPASDAARSWLLDTARRRATRWHGLYELLGLHDHRWSSPEPALEVRERLAMARAFVAEPAADVSLAMTLEFVRQVKDPEFDRALMGQLEPLLDAPDPPWWLKRALERALPRCHDRVLRRRMERRLRELRRIRPEPASLSWLGDKRGAGPKPLCLDSLLLVKPGGAPRR